MAINSRSITMSRPSSWYSGRPGSASMRCMRATARPTLVSAPIRASRNARPSVGCVPLPPAGMAAAARRKSAIMFRILASRTGTVPAMSARVIRKNRCRMPRRSASDISRMGIRSTSADSEPSPVLTTPNTS